jgi:phosphoglycolate phosphatase
MMNKSATQMPFDLSTLDLSNFDLLLFDLDGTLVDSAPDIAAAVDDTLQARGWPPAGVVRVRSWIGNGSRKLIERALLYAHGSRDDALLDAVHSEFLLHYAQHNGPETRVFPSVYDFLQHCTTIGKTLACVTNKPEHLARQLLQHLDMKKYFAMIIGGDTFPQRKPDPTALLHCCTQLHTPVARTLMIGDSETDVKSARAANMKVLCVSYGYNRSGHISVCNPDWVVDNFSVLIR